MTPILSKSLESESAACIPPKSWPAVAQPYLVPPQTAGNAFFMWTSKTLRVIKIAPAFGSGDQPLWSENGMWEEETR